jgi:hypothetical protein
MVRNVNYTEKMIPEYRKDKKPQNTRREKIEVKRNGNYKHERKIKINFDLIIMGNKIT